MFDGSFSLLYSSSSLSTSIEVSVSEEESQREEHTTLLLVFFPRVSLCVTLCCCFAGDLSSSSNLKTRSSSNVCFPRAHSLEVVVALVGELMVSCCCLSLVVVADVVLEFLRPMGLENTTSSSSMYASIPRPYVEQEDIQKKYISIPGRAGLVVMMPQRRRRRRKLTQERGTTYTV